MARSEQSSRIENPKKRLRLSNGPKSLASSAKKQIKTREKPKNDAKTDCQNDGNENLLGWSPIRIIRIPET